MRRQSHYQSTVAALTFLNFPNAPSWRTPQAGALAAAIAAWSITPSERLLLSMPTGSGKSGVATALPYLASSHRVLVVVPSRELRTQMSEAFRTEQVLRTIGAVTSLSHPVVEEVQGRTISWAALESADVVVGLPNSLSPGHLETGHLPPPDFFDLIIVDEAHHAPAATWLAILDHFPAARTVLLTATPRRADGRRIPGTHAFHYPLRLAIQDGIYQRIQPTVLPVTSQSTIVERDRAIADAVIAAAKGTAHQTSAVLIRVSTVLRADLIASLYRSLGLEVEVLVGTTPPATRQQILRDWSTGDLRAVVAVDMLGEGIDIPRLRIVGYHDKHKSALATMQFIGRLARTHATYPQPSRLITVRDQDIFPALQGALRQLYDEDADWAELLPSFIDDEVQEVKLDVAYLEQYPTSPPQIDLAAVAPLARSVIYEAPESGAFQPPFTNHAIPSELRAGETLAGQTIVYSGLNENGTQLVVITSQLVAPRWYIDDDLTRNSYDLVVINWHPSGRTDRRHLLFINAKDRRLLNAARNILDPAHLLRGGDPAHLQEAFDSLERYSVSSIGVRNTYAATPGTPAYAMFSGSGVDRGLREADTSSRALGHAMAQVEPVDGGSTNAGMSSAKSKYWETRYLRLRAYEAFSVDLAGRYWFPRTTTSGPLLPNVARAVRTERFSAEPVIFCEIDPALIGRGWTLNDGRALEALELHQDPHHSSTTQLLALELMDPRDPATPVWTGTQNLLGDFETRTSTATATRGAGQQASIADLFDRAAPSIYFLDGHTVYGPVTYLPTATQQDIPDAVMRTAWAWSGTDIQLEAKRHSRTDTIHDAIERRIIAQPARPGFQRWTLCNDGAGEIADHVVIEHAPNRRPRVELWHAKASSHRQAGVRVTDMQVVTQQAAKSRRHITDRQFWHRVGRRLLAEETPRLHLLSGSADELLALCGRITPRLDESIAARPPAVEGHIVVVQPGLSLSQLDNQLAAHGQSAGQIREFMTFLANAVQGLSTLEVIGSA